MRSSMPVVTQGRATLALAGSALRAWTPRQRVAAVAATALVALVIGLATVLIPNPVFAREIPPVWWNYPVWWATSAFSGMLLATYVTARPGADADASDSAAAARDGSTVALPEIEERRTSRMGVAGGMLAWFAVGCPVCNKLALLALGYSGAITWFAPVQPFMAVGALLLSGVALLWRLRGQVACPVRPRAVEVAR